MKKEFWYTPGPWYAYRLKKRYNHPVFGVCADHDSSRVAQVYHPDETATRQMAGLAVRGYRLKECEANAALIASAPDMLQTLIKVKNWLPPNSSTEIVEDIETAISKALGKGSSIRSTYTIPSEEIGIGINKTKP